MESHVSGVRRPLLDDGPLKQLVFAIHDLYESVKSPGLAAIDAQTDKQTAQGWPRLSRSTVSNMLRGEVVPLSKRANIASLTIALLALEKPPRPADEHDQDYHAILDLHRVAFETSPANRWGQNIADHFAEVGLRWGGAIDEGPRGGTHGIATVSCPPLDKNIELGAFAPQLHWQVSDMFESQMYLRFGTTSWHEQTDGESTWWGIQGPRVVGGDKHRTAVLLVGARLDSVGVVSVYFRDCLPPGEHVVGHLAFDALSAAFHIAAMWGLSGHANATLRSEAYPPAGVRRRVGTGRHSAQNFSLELGAPKPDEHISSWARQIAGPIIATSRDGSFVPWLAEAWGPEPRSESGVVAGSISNRELDELLSNLYRWHVDGLAERLNYLKPRRGRSS
jgi:hypothetical protein